MPLYFVVTILSCTLLQAQSTEIGKQVYSSSEESVFLIYLNDASGTPTALGSGFLVGKRTLITNAHVVEAGEPVLAVGPVRIPLKVVAIDRDDDLAELSVSVDLTSMPLSLAADSVKPGEQIFTLGNPEGLEKTISEGIVSGIRNRNGRKLIQITSPISHGSSGGPVLNAQGQVVGVAVGMLEDGQNLNFAVPVQFVKQLLEIKPGPSTSFELQKSLNEAERLDADRIKSGYSDEAGSPYQIDLYALKDILNSILRNTSDAHALTQVVCYGTEAFELSDVGIQAARKLANSKVTAEGGALLAYALYDRSEDEGGKAFIAKEGSQEQNEAKAAHDKFLSEANDVASGAKGSAKGDSSVLADFVLGKAKEDRGDYAGAIPLDEQVAHGSESVCGNDLVKTAYQDLIESNVQLNRPDSAEKWFIAYASKYEPSAWEWDKEGDRRQSAHDSGGSAGAYEKAALASPVYYGYDYCYAAANRYLQEPSQEDALLADGRACIEASTKNSDKEQAKLFTHELPFVYTDMAGVLKDRGVYDAALQYAKEAINLKPDDPFPYYKEAEIYQQMHQNAECVAAAQNAIRVSDGKFSFMHFVLGNCYFEMENWTMAANSFRIAAEADRTDAPSAFNLALSLMNEERADDAQEWLREALRRNPDNALRNRIEKLIH